MLHPHTEVKWISEIIGCGVLACRPIPSGTITWVRDPLDRVLTPEQVETLPALCRDTFLKYSYRNAGGEYVFCWDNTRFMNHSFNPNCITTAYGFEMAVRDIAPGEELTNDYGSLNILEPFHACDEGSGRKTVYPDDLVRHANDWDRQLKRAFCRFPQVDQPLRDILSAEQLASAEAVAAGRTEMVSILACLHRPEPERAGRPGSASSSFQRLEEITSGNATAI
jgi:uncharacterized protein